MESNKNIHTQRVPFYSLWNFDDVTNHIKNWNITEKIYNRKELLHYFGPFEHVFVSKTVYSF